MVFRPGILEDSYKCYNVFTHYTQFSLQFTQLGAYLKTKLSSLKFCLHTSYQSIYKLQVFHVRSNKEMTVYKRFIYRDLYMYRNTDRVKHRPHSGSLINHTRQLKNANFKNMFAWPVHARMERQEKQT